MLRSSLVRLAEVLTIQWRDALRRFVVPQSQRLMVASKLSQCTELATVSTFQRTKRRYHRSAWRKSCSKSVCTREFCTISALSSAFCFGFSSTLFRCSPLFRSSICSFRFLCKVIAVLKTESPEWSEWTLCDARQCFSRRASHYRQACQPRLAYAQYSHANLFANSLSNG